MKQAAPPGRWRGLQASAKVASPSGGQGGGLAVLQTPQGLSTCGLSACDLWGEGDEEVHQPPWCRGSEVTHSPSQRPRTLGAGGRVGTSGSAGFLYRRP